MTKTVAKSNAEGPPSKLIDAHIKAHSGWRGEMLARIRALIKEADPEVVEEWKWDIPVWSHAGIICTAMGPVGKRGLFVELIQQMRTHIGIVSDAIIDAAQCWPIENQLRE